MAKADLTVARLREVFHYDPETGVFRRLTAWGQYEVLSVARGTPHPHGYIVMSVDGRRYLAHRLAWFYAYGEWPKIIDHKFGDRADNRLALLRSNTQAFNRQNQRVARLTSSSGLMGVRWDARRSKWAVELGLNGRRVFRKRFGTLLDAAAAYLTNKRRLHAGCTI